MRVTGLAKRLKGGAIRPIGGHGEAAVLPDDDAGIPGLSPSGASGGDQPPSAVNPAASIAAIAQVSSLSDESPVIPTAPSTWLSLTT